MAKHTPGPWIVINERYIRVADDVEDYAHATIAEATDFNWRWRDDAMVEANARRIVAAANFCEGVSTEALEDSTLQDLLLALDDPIRKAAPELLEALQAVEDGERFLRALDALDYAEQTRICNKYGISTDLSSPAAYTELLDIAESKRRAAIAKALGEV